MSAGEPRPVVAAVDRKSGSAGVLRYAVDQAVRAGASLHLVHALPGGSPQDLVPVVAWAERRAEGSAVLDQSVAAARAIAPALEISTELVVGSLVAAVLGAARDGRLLVVGRSPHHRVETPGGGTPAALATRAECPDVVVPSSWTAGAGPGDVVVAMKSRTHARELLSHAFDIAEERGARVRVVTAWELYDPVMDRNESRDHAAQWEAEGKRVLAALVEPWQESYPSVPVDLQVIHGRAATVLEQASVGADLLLLARREHMVPPYGRLGSTAHRVLRTSQSPVEVVPAGVVAADRAMSTSGSHSR
jgi:nucleotide-binding universal stress UspA family protein